MFSCFLVTEAGASAGHHRRLFAVLLIFVLAQIFRRGSEMRAELAGTI
jgi:hypothetical protein